MKNKILACTVGLALAFSVGCQSAGTPDSSARNELLAQAAVVYATGKVVENNPKYGPRIAQIAGEVRAVAAGESFATVDLLMAFVESKIDKSKLSPADIGLVNLLLDAVRTELIARLGAVELPADKLLIVEKVAFWIENAALASTPQ